MNEDRSGRLLQALSTLLEVIAQEASTNPAFARKVEAAFKLADHALRPQRRQEAAPQSSAEFGKGQTLLQNVTFDPLECHLEAALLGGREQEARAFLGKLDRSQLEEVVKAQRLPGAKSLHKTILEGDAASAVDAIVGSAEERVRSRISAAR
jgi:hypothetical protein